MLLVSVFGLTLMQNWMSGSACFTGLILFLWNHYHLMVIAVNLMLLVVLVTRRSSTRRNRSSRLCWIFECGIFPSTWPVFVSCVHDLRSHGNTGFLVCVPLRDEWRNEDGTHVPEPPNDEFIFQVRHMRLIYMMNSWSISFSSSVPSVSSMPQCICYCFRYWLEWYL